VLIESSPVAAPSWLLAELVKSELASAEERSLSHTVFTEEARFDPHGTDLRLSWPAQN